MKDVLFNEDINDYRKEVISRYNPQFLTISDIESFSNSLEIPMVFEEFSKECRFDIYCFRKDYEEISIFIEERKAAGVLFNLIPIDTEIEYSHQALIEYRGKL